jgi:hypothetical protein
MAIVIPHLELLVASPWVTDHYSRFVLHMLSMGEPVLHNLGATEQMVFVRKYKEDGAHNVSLADTFLRDGEFIGVRPSAKQLVASDAWGYSQTVAHPRSLAALFQALLVLWCPTQYSKEAGFFKMLQNRRPCPQRRTRQARCAALVTALRHPMVRYEYIVPKQLKRKRGDAAAEPPASNVIHSGDLSALRPHFGFLLRHNLLQVAGNVVSIHKASLEATLTPAETSEE